MPNRQTCKQGVDEVGCVSDDGGDKIDSGAHTINEVSCSGMFVLDETPDVTDAKLPFAYDALRGVAGDGLAGSREWVGHLPEEV